MIWLQLLRQVFKKKDKLRTNERGLTIEGFYKTFEQGALTSKPYAFRSRPWELRTLVSFDITDSLCSSIRMDYRGTEVLRIVPYLNEKLNEEWISDRVRFFYDGLKKQRLVFPAIRYKTTFINHVSWKRLVEFFRQVVLKMPYYSNWFGPYNKIDLKFKQKKHAFITLEGLIGGMVDIKTIVNFAKFLRKLGCQYIGYGQIEINADNDIRSEYFLDINTFEKSECIILCGTNLRIEIPLLNLKIRNLIRYKKQTQLNIFSIGANMDLTYPVTQIGSNLLNLIAIIEGRHWVSKFIEESKASMILIGASLTILRQNKFLINLLKNKSIEFIKEKRDKKIYFGMIYPWVSMGGSYESGTIVPKYQINFSKKENTQGFELKVIYNLAMDEIKQISKSNHILIYQGHHGEENAVEADVLIPGTLPYEKESSFINLCGVLIKNNKVLPKPSSEMVIDWKVFKWLSEFLGIDFSNNLKRTKFIKTEHEVLRVKLGKREVIKKIIRGGNKREEKDRRRTNEENNKEREWNNGKRMSFIIKKREEIKEYMQINKKGLNNWEENFYLSNAISRASKIMAIASKGFRKKHKNWLIRNK
jgi:NADH dehydrogenase/NADH:ubiquinone oxidoreductase subunit G